VEACHGSGCQHAMWSRELQETLTLLCDATKLLPPHFLIIVVFTCEWCLEGIRAAILPLLPPGMSLGPAIEAEAPGRRDEGVVKG
jgi:hypothetical protein